MQIDQVTIDYQANYNGCTVCINDGLDEFSIDDAITVAKMNALQDAVIAEAYKSVIKSGRLEGHFNGDDDELGEWALNRATEIFGTDVDYTFQSDWTST